MVVCAGARVETTQAKLDTALTATEKARQAESTANRRADQTAVNNNTTTIKTLFKFD
jgi:hypothetical protein